MRKKLLISVFNWLFIISVFGQNKEIMTIDGSFSSNKPMDSEIGVVKAEDKRLHVSSKKASQLVPLYNKQEMASFHPLATHIIDQAMGKWEKKIYVPKGRNIDIYFKIDSQLPSDLAFQIDLPYMEFDNTYIPLPLAIAKHNYVPDEGVEMLIKLNSDAEKWFFEGDADNSEIRDEQYDFETGVLRALAHCFGFGSSVTRKRPFFGRLYSIFDKSIVNSDNILLSDIDKQNTSALSEYITGNNVYFNTSLSRYKLYAPISYDQSLSLKYFDENEGLMSPHFMSQTGYRNIDTKVMNVMEALGWKMITDGQLEIKSNNIDNSTGLGNIANSYEFYHTSSGIISNPVWTYSIRKKDNTYEIIKTDNQFKFQILPLLPKDYFYRDENGDFNGKIQLQALLDDSSVSAEFNIRLEAKPAIPIFDVRIIKTNDWSFDVEVILSSSGAADLYFTLIDYGIGEEITKCFNDQSYVKYTYRYMYYDSPFSIDFEARNNYGSITASYYNEGVSFMDNSHNNQKPLKAIKSIKQHEIYILPYGKLYQIQLGGDLVKKQNLPSGNYLIKTEYNDGSFELNKINVIVK